MKLIKVSPDGTVTVEAETALESLYEVGEYIEYEYRDFLIIAKDGKRYTLK